MDNKKYCLIMDKQTADELIHAIQTAMDFTAEAQSYSHDAEEIESHQQSLNMLSELQEEIRCGLSTEHFCVVQWSDDDLKNAIVEAGYEATPEHIAAMREYCMSRDTFLDRETEFGNDVLNDIATIVHDLDWNVN